MGSSPRFPLDARALRPDQIGKISRRLPERRRPGCLPGPGNASLPATIHGPHDACHTCLIARYPLGQRYERILKTIHLGRFSEERSRPYGTIDLGDYGDTEGYVIDGRRIDILTLFRR